MSDAARVVEQVARESYGRLVAYLSSHTRDLAAAEDALGDALLSALKDWPRDGVPERPEAWLLTAARHRLIDRSRHEKVRSMGEATLKLLAERREHAPEDQRLKLLFVCAHPALDASLHTPLMLQTVLGLDAARISAAFLVAPATMGQRLVRAKTKIRDAGIPFRIPEETELPSRLAAVREAIYAAYGIGWEGVDAGGLAEEAVWLSRMLAERLPADPEARGLLALLLFCESRRPARRAADGAYVPLSEQDSALWSGPMIEAAERELREAFRAGRPGRFQLEAAIQSVHAERRRTGRTEWAAIAAFYDQLIRIAPTHGAWVARAAALAELQGPDAGLALLDELPPGDYPSAWAVRAHLLLCAGRTADARVAFERAIELSADPAVKSYLRGRIVP